MCETWTPAEHPGPTGGGILMPIPRIVIAGTGSGVGKTSISIGLARAFSSRGMRVQTFKSGPDYLDPTHLSLASGRPCYNLDGWMMGKDYVRKLFNEKCLDADIAVVEGVMGIFDGAGADTLAGSTAEIANWLNAPILLAVNAHGVARTFAALVKGCVDFTTGLNIACVVANNTGSKRHVDLLEESLSNSSAPPLVGGIPRGGFHHLSGRHLGLVSADSTPPSRDISDGLAVSVEKYLNLGRIVEIASQAPDIEHKPSDRLKPAGGKKIRIAVAKDPAFHFYYSDLLEMIEAAGGEILEFSPMQDKAVPPEAAGLYLGGGYPEACAAELSGNREMLDSIRKFAKSGKPVYAECGGLMYLSTGIETEEKWFEMAGILPVGTRMLNRRKSLGYVEATLRKDSLWGAAGALFRGHEFHYSELIGMPAEGDGWKRVYSIKYRRSKDAVAEGYQKGNVLASYAHLHYASSPGAVAHFLKSCGKVKGKRDVQYPKL